MKIKRILSLISMFAVGGLIGAGIALLMAPQSGKRMRSKLRDKGVELKEIAVETAEDTRHRAGKTFEDLTSQTKDRISSLKKRSQELVNA